MKKKPKRGEYWDGIIACPSEEAEKRMSKKEVAALIRRKDIEARGMRGEIPLIPYRPKTRSKPTTTTKEKT